MIRPWAAVILASVPALHGCGAPAVRTVSPVILRAAVLGIEPSQIDPVKLAALESGAVDVGSTDTDVYLARGRPVLWWRTTSRCKVLIHASPTDGAIADATAMVCDGVVVQRASVEPPLPCWRLAVVGPRLVADLAYFEQRPLDVQWQIVVGILRRGQSTRDVTIAFGKPFNTGVDEREDGKRAEEHVYLDPTGEAYGMRVTFIAERVAAWKIPAERILTPAAQQRRLEAMEKRLTDRLAAMEQASIKRHAESVTLFNQVMARQDEMMSAIVEKQAAEEARRTAITDAIAGVSEPPAADPERAGTGVAPATPARPTRSTTKQKTPDLMEVRSRCVAACERAYEDLKSSCGERRSSMRAECKGKGSCQQAVESDYVTCASSASYVKCTKKCDR